MGSKSRSGALGSTHNESQEELLGAHYPALGG